MSKIPVPQIGFGRASVSPLPSHHPPFPCSLKAGGGVCISRSAAPPPPPVTRDNSDGCRRRGAGTGRCRWRRAGWWRSRSAASRSTAPRRPSSAAGRSCPRASSIRSPGGRVGGGVHVAVGPGETGRPGAGRVGPGGGRIRRCSLPGACVPARPRACAPACPRACLPACPRASPVPPCVEDGGVELRLGDLRLEEARVGGGGGWGVGRISGGRSRPAARVAGAGLGRGAGPSRWRRARRRGPSRAVRAGTHRLEPAGSPHPPLLSGRFSTLHQLTGARRLAGVGLPRRVWARVRGRHGRGSV